MASIVGDVLRSTTRFEKANVHWHRPVITGVVTGLIAAICIATGNQSYALPLAMGSWFTSVLDSHQVFGTHLRTMCGSALWLALGATIGGLASSTGYWQLLIVAVMALACGFAGAFGDFGTRAGSLTLAMYALFAGIPMSERSALQSGLLTLIGGAITIVITIALYLVGARSQLIAPCSGHESALTRLKSHMRPGDMFLRHGVRLSVLMVVATALAHSVTWPHEYWIPMTVAWVARPGSQLTLERTWLRILGTLAGIVIITCLMLITGNPPYELAILVGVGVAILLAFVQANYAVAVIGLTMAIMALFGIEGESVDANAPYRFLATIVAGILLTIATLVWPVDKNSSTT
jgi:MFS family permease